MFDIKEIVNETHINSLLSLQEKIYKILKENGHDNYILPKSFEDYKMLLQDPELSIVGVFDDDKIIAQLVVKNSDHQNSSYNKLILNQKFYEIANVLVDPEYNGRGIARKMIEFVKNMPKYKNSTLTAEIEIGNLASIKSFLNSGFVVVNTEKSVIDEAEISILAFNSDLNKQIFDEGFVEISQNLKYDEYEELTSMGLITVGYGKTRFNKSSQETDIFIMKKSKILLDIEEEKMEYWRKINSNKKESTASKDKSSFDETRDNKTKFADKLKESRETCSMSVGVN